MNRLQTAQYIINKLDINSDLFATLFKKTETDMIHWRPNDSKWCMLEIVCHLRDEETEDFRQRTQWMIEKPGQTPPPIDPVGWVQSRHYLDQDFHEQATIFLEERMRSVAFLNGLDLDHVPWENGYDHPSLGYMDAWLFFTNWLAHDHHHIRQINRLQYAYFRQNLGDDLKYAGDHRVFF